MSRKGLITCPHSRCQLRNRAGAEFCARCGTSLANIGPAAAPLDAHGEAAEQPQFDARTGRRRRSGRGTAAAPPPSPPPPYAPPPPAPPPPYAPPPPPPDHDRGGDGHARQSYLESLGSQHSPDRERRGDGPDTSQPIFQDFFGAPPPEPRRSRRQRRRDRAAQQVQQTHRQPTGSGYDARSRSGDPSGGPSRGSSAAPRPSPAPRKRGGGWKFWIGLIIALGIARYLSKQVQRDAQNRAISRQIHEQQEHLNRTRFNSLTRERFDRSAPRTPGHKGG